MKRILSLALVLLMVLSVLSTFAACSEKTDWTVREDDTILPLEMDLAGDENQQKLVVTYTEDVFNKNISERMIRINAYDFITSDTQSTETTTDSAEPNVTELSDFTVTRDSAKQLTITLKSGVDSAHWGYTVAVNKKATIQKQYGECFGFLSSAEGNILGAYCEIEGSFSTAVSDPVINILLTNTTAGTELKPEMVKLSGAFASLTVTDVQGENRRITVKTSGQPRIRDAINGCVMLTEDATEAKAEICAFAEVKDVVCYVDEASYVFQDNILKFDICLNGDTFTPELKAGDVFSSDRKNLTVEAVSGSRVTVSIAARATNISQAILDASGIVFTLKADYLSSHTEKQVTVTAMPASIAMVIDYIEYTEGNTYKTNALLYVQNGSLKEAITAEELCFDGDFAGAQIKALKCDGSIYQIEFTFEAQDADPQNEEFDGKVYITAGKLMNLWGTESTNLSCQISYNMPDDRSTELSLWEEIDLWSDIHAEGLKGVSRVGTGIQCLSSLADCTIKVLELSGVIESTDAKIEAVRQEIKTAQTMITQISSQVSGMKNAMDAQFDKVLDAQYIDIFGNASQRWNTFLARYVAPLNNIIEEYYIAYKSYMLNYINNAKTFGVTVYVDENGNVTLPGVIDGYSIDGKKIVSANEYVFTPGLELVIEKILKNSGSIYDSHPELLDQRAAALIKVKVDAGRERYNQIYDLLWDHYWYNQLDEETWNFTGENYNDLIYDVNASKISADDFCAYFEDLFEGEIAFYDFNWASLMKYFKGAEFYYEDDNTAYYSDRTVARTLLVKDFVDLSRIEDTRGYWQDIQRSVSDAMKSYETNMRDSIPIVRTDGTKDDQITGTEYLVSLELNAAYSALKKVGTTKIMSAYRDFCYALGGGLADYPTITATNTPIDDYNLIMSTYYNFYSESITDLQKMRNWLLGIVNNAVGIAELAKVYTPEISSGGYVNDATVYALNKIKNDFTAKQTVTGSQYSYVAGAMLTVDGGQKAVFAGDYRGSNLCANKIYLVTDINVNYWFPAKYMDRSNIYTMIRRYNVLKRDGVTTAQTFADYLVSLNLVSDRLKNGYVVTSMPYVENVPKNNTMSMHTREVSSNFKHFTVGDTIRIGDNGPRKAKNYRYATQLKADLMTLNGDVTDGCIYAHASYASYPFFSTSKNTGYADLCLARTPNNFFVFRLN